MGEMQLDWILSYVYWHAKYKLHKFIRKPGKRYSNCIDDDTHVNSYDSAILLLFHMFRMLFFLMKCLRVERSRVNFVFDKNWLKPARKFTTGYKTGIYPKY